MVPVFLMDVILGVVFLLLFFCFGGGLFVG
jgi:hypothetical protein